MADKLRWGIVSTAKIGTEKVIPAMQQSQFCDIVAIASRSQEKAEATAAELGIPKAYGSYEALLADSELYRSMRRSHNPYGDGQASGRILDALRG